MKSKTTEDTMSSSIHKIQDHSDCEPGLIEIETKFKAVTVETKELEKKLCDGLAEKTEQIRKTIQDAKEDIETLKQVLETTKSKYEKVLIDKTVAERDLAEVEKSLKEIELRAKHTSIHDSQDPSIDSVKRLISLRSLYYIMTYISWDHSDSNRAKGYVINSKDNSITNFDLVESENYVSEYLWKHIAVSISKAWDQL